MALDGRSRLATATAVAAVAAAAVLASALAKAARRRRLQEEAASFESKSAAVCAEASVGGDPADGELDEAHSIKTRVGNFKVSKLSRLVEDVAAACGSDVRYDVRASADANEADVDDAGAQLTAEERQIELEHRAVQGALSLVRLARGSDVHRRLPHFHAVDRQLEALARQLDVVDDNLGDFWRYGREEPMADLLSLPIVRLGERGQDEAPIVPVPRCFLEHDGEGDDANGSGASAAAAAMLGVAEDAERPELEGAYRRRARELHRHGECTDRDAFHALTAAFERLALAPLAAVGAGAKRPRSMSDAVRGTEIIAHYLLVGTDPCGSRYREYSRGLLDGPHRERLAQKLDMLVNWGEASGSLTGLGQG